MSTSLTDFVSWAFPVIFICSLALVGFRMREGIKALKAQGRAIRPKLPSDALFAESGASGSSQRNLMTKLGGASRVLHVWVTSREFVVESIFPFNVWMYENPYDLEHRVPVASLTLVEEGPKGDVFVSFDDSEQRPHQLRLFVKQPGALVAALKSLGTPSNNTLERTREA